MPTPSELDAFFAQNIPLGTAPAYGVYGPPTIPDMNAPIALGGASANLAQTPAQEAERTQYFNTPSYPASMQPQLHGGNRDDSGGGNQDDSGWRDVFAGMADAGAALQGRQGMALSTLAQQRQNQMELKQKLGQAKEAKQQKRFEFMVKANESPDPDVRKRMMKAALQAGVITEQDEAVLSKVPSGKLKMWAPRLQKESPRIWDSYKNGELPDAIVNEIIKQQESRDAEEYAMQRIPELENERASGSISPTNRAMLDFFEKTYGPQLLKVQREREALGKEQMENERSAAINSVLRGAAPPQGPVNEPVRDAVLNIQSPALAGATAAAVAPYHRATAEAGKTVVQTNVNTFASASEELQKSEAKKLSDTRDKLQTAPQVLSNIEKAKELIPGARGFMGSGGETLLNAANFLNNRLGTQIDVRGIKNAEELRSRIFFNILENLKKLDAQPSEQQQRIMQESLGNLGTDPNALYAVLDAYAETIRDKVALYNQNAKSATEHGLVFPYDPFIKLDSGASLSPKGKSVLERLNKAVQGK